MGKLYRNNEKGEQELVGEYYTGNNFPSPLTWHARFIEEQRDYNQANSDEHLIEEHQLATVESLLHGTELKYGEALPEPAIEIPSPRNEYANRTSLSLLWRNGKKRLHLLIYRNGELRLYDEFPRTYGVLERPAQLAAALRELFKGEKGEAGDI